MTGENATLMLEGLVECGPCGEKMVAVHDPEHRYACPVLLRHGPDDCPTPPVPVEQLDFQAARWITEETMTERRVEQMVREIMAKSAARKAPWEKDLEKTRREIRKQERDRRNIMDRVESGRSTFRKMAGKLGRLNKRREKLLEQADEAREQVQLWEFVGRETRIRENATDIQTYLNPGTMKMMQQLLGRMLERVVVGPHDITFRHGREGPPGGESRVLR